MYSGFGGERCCHIISFCPMSFFSYVFLVIVTRYPFHLCCHAPFRGWSVSACGCILVKQQFLHKINRKWRHFSIIEIYISIMCICIVIIHDFLFKSSVVLIWSFMCEYYVEYVWIRCLVWLSELEKWLHLEPVSVLIAYEVVQW